MDNVLITPKLYPFLNKYCETRYGVNIKTLIRAVDETKDSSPQLENKGKRSYTETAVSIEQRLISLLDGQNRMGVRLKELENKADLSAEEISTLKNYSREQTETLEFLKQLEKQSLPDGLAATLMDLLKRFTENNEIWFDTLHRSSKISEENTKFLADLATSFKAIEERLKGASVAGQLKINAVIQLVKEEVLPVLEEFKKNQIATKILLETLVNQVANSNLQILYEEGQFTSSSSQNEPPSFLSQQSSSKTLSIETFGIDSREFSFLQETVLPLLLKSRNGEKLTAQEKAVLENVPVQKIALLVGRDGMEDGSGIFDFSSGTIFKLFLTIKDVEINYEDLPLSNLQKNEILTQPMGSDMQNSLAYRTELFFVILKNDKTLTLKQVLDFFHKQLFEKGLSHLMNRNIFLESLQIQQVSPQNEAKALPQMSYSSAGRLPTDLFTTSPRPFCFSLMPAFTTGSRNSFQIRFYGISSEFLNFRKLGADEYNLGIGSVQTFLKEEIIIGNNNDLIIRSCVQTRSKNSPKSFIPVGEVSVGGFIVNSNPQNKKRGSVPVPIDRSQQGESTSP